MEGKSPTQIVRFFKFAFQLHEIISNQFGKFQNLNDQSKNKVAVECK